MYVNHDEFKELLHRRGNELYRDMPWRRDTRPYFVLVSELMLQQTQVSRVIPKFEAFITVFPDINSLAAAPLSDVLKNWVGLGYNRRAKYLHAAARKIVTEYGSVFPSDFEEIKKLPGVGEATAGAILTYAFNQPHVFIETNVRTVYINAFFTDDQQVSDKQLIPYIEATLDMDNPREFYWAIMDYGSWLKRVVGKKTHNQSIHYKKQSPLKGSVREIRGQIIRVLGENNQTPEALKEKITFDKRFEPALEGLIKDGLVAIEGDILQLTK